MKQRLSILLVGKGSMGRRYAETISRQFAFINLVWVGHRELESSSIVETIMNVSKITPKVAGIIVAGPSTQRRKILKICEKLRVKCLVEKPLSSSTESLEGLNSQFLRSSVSVGYNLRFLQAFSILKNMLRNHALGKLLFVEAQAGSALPYWRRDLELQDSVTSSAALGGGVILELSHELDYLLWFFGEIKINYVELRRLNEYTIDTEDFGLIVGEVLDKPLLVKLECLALEPYRKLIISGSRGEVHWDGVKGTLTHYCLDDEPLVLIDQDWIKDTYTTQLQAFIGWLVDGEKRGLCGFDEGIDVVRIAEKIKFLGGFE